MTKKEAILQTIDMWKWLAEIGARKRDYLNLVKKLTFEEIYNIQNACYLCEYKEKSKFKTCPIFKRCFDCMKPQYNYVEWIDSGSVEKRKRIAYSIYLALREYYEKKYLK